MPSSNEILSQFTLRSVQDQLDMIYHEGLDAWREKIKAIKDEFPKGTTY